MMFAVQLGDITVDSVHPLYGPVSGGTRVTISGQFLSINTVIAVHFGQYVRTPETHRLSILCILMDLSTVSVVKYLNTLVFKYYLNTVSGN